MPGSVRLKSETCAGRYRRRTSMRRIFFVHAVKRQLHFIADGKPVFPREFFETRHTAAPFSRSSAGNVRPTHTPCGRELAARRICNRKTGAVVSHGSAFETPANIARARSRKKPAVTSSNVRVCLSLSKQISACVALCGALRRDQCVFNGGFAFSW